jgi:hypothetical protein
MEIGAEKEVNRLLVKAGRLRRVAGAASMAKYRSMILRVARELEARAAALQIELERQAQKNIFAHPQPAH